MKTPHFDRRSFLGYFTAIGLGGTLFPGVLWGMAENTKKISKDMVREAAAVSGLEFDDAQIEMMLGDLDSRRKAYAAIHDLHIPNAVAPALLFNPVLPGMTFDMQKRPMRISKAPVVSAPKNIEDLAFATLRELAELVRAKKVSSLALTQMYLERLKRYDPVLKFVITFTEERALAQAKEADKDIAAGKYRGPLHGLPWGAKDLLSVKGFRTTWGAGGFEEQKFDEDAEAVKRLDRAGAVLVAKMTLGALAQGDVWFGGVTRNPWKADQGSSGSSAGSSSAVAAGCLAFAVGSETLGSIASPSTRNGATGLRPTFGRVPRTGAMALSWTMDKLGPICRAVEDCAIVLNSIYGPDGADRTVIDVPFNWDAAQPLAKIRVGYLKEDFERDAPAEASAEAKAARKQGQAFDNAALDIIQNKLGIKLTAVKMPDLPAAAMRPILVAEAAAAFDELTRSGRDKLLTAQGANDWPNTFRTARFIPAVEYVNANRARTLLMEAMAKIFKDVDVIVAPTFSGQLLITNLTGHPAVILPNGFRDQAPDGKPGDGTPVSLTFLGNLFAEDKLCAVAKAYQDATPFHKKHPKIPTEPVPLPEKK